MRLSRTAGEIGEEGGGFFGKRGDGARVGAELKRPEQRNHQSTHRPGFYSSPRRIEQKFSSIPGFHGTFTLHPTAPPRSPVSERTRGRFLDHAILGLTQSETRQTVDLLQKK